MCRRPAIRSTSGFTTRAVALISRRVRGPKRIAFRAGRRGGSCPAGPPGMLLARAAAETVVSRRCGVDIVIPPGRPELPAPLTC